MNTNKIDNKLCYCKYTMLVLFTFLYSAIHAQTSLKVVNNTRQYQQMVQQDSLQKMILLHQLIPGIQYDLRYAGTNNFMQRLMYPKNLDYSFLRLPVAKALDSVQKELSKQGLGLKVFDAYRPYGVTVKFWELVQDERYVANPAKGSGHNRGIAVDVTIIHLVSGNELDMGTGFDNFSDTAHHSFTQLSSAILDNRKLLKTTMEKYAFKALETEWWHFSLPNNRQYEVLDISFPQLKKLSRKH
jgi:D-alanyl-D-alanine dipeptidase